MMLRAFLTMLMLASYSLLMGCGTQGPLYIPEQRYPQETQDQTSKTPDATPTEQTNKE